MKKDLNQNRAIPSCRMLYWSVGHIALSWTAFDYNICNHFWYIFLIFRESSSDECVIVKFIQYFKSWNIGLHIIKVNNWLLIHVLMRSFLKFCLIQCQFVFYKIKYVHHFIWLFLLFILFSHIWWTLCIWV